MSNASLANVDDDDDGDVNDDDDDDDVNDDDDDNVMGTKSLRQIKMSWSVT